VDSNLLGAYLANPSVSSLFDYNNFKQTLIWVSIATFGLGLLWMTLTFCFPQLAPTLAHVLGALVLIAVGVLLLVLWDR
jgi:putative Mn2+ efflux pump MntP